ncbi:hypothetical protein [Hansschlegelia zhihuaiae]|uniref:Uncharacterized protein n=1 Tax=Hansschlegelia zhihuaiae TaxID=405005 RepID=A0A4Q0MF58_9HYPH|nr:hypothetical protein [Hansschlegelia zhihuaiae]RXF72098.1 hypothetical protein EK403_14915 [Hansschlegelia zhihuaiae]
MSRLFRRLVWLLASAILAVNAALSVEGWWLAKPTSLYATFCAVLFSGFAILLSFLLMRFRGRI